MAINIPQRIFSLSLIMMVMNVRSIQALTTTSGTTMMKSIIRTCSSSYSSSSVVGTMGRRRRQQQKCGIRKNYYTSSSLGCDNNNNNNEANTNTDTPSSTSSSYPPYWEQLGKPQTIMAPMVAQSDLAFRTLCRRYGTELCYTQMIHSSNFCKSVTFQNNHLDVYRDDGSEGVILSDSGKTVLNGLMDWGGDGDGVERRYNELIRDDVDIDKGDDGRWTIYSEGDTDIPIPGSNIARQQQQRKKNPLIVQLAGNDPQIMSQAAMAILHRTNLHTNSNTNTNTEYNYNGAVSGIDINCGCPQSIARKGRYGAFLMEEDNGALVCDIIRRLRTDLPRNVGVSVKIRIPLVEEGVGGGGASGGDDAVLKDRICRLIDAGVDLITVHGRTIQENKTKTRSCNWDAIATSVQIARTHSGNPNYPIVANGGIEFPTDVRRCLDYTGASAVMSSEALLEHPGLFGDVGVDVGDEEDGERGVLERQIKFCHEYIELCVKYPPLPGSLGRVGGSFNIIRGHLFKMLYRYLEENTDLRSRLGHPTETNTLQHARDIVTELESRYSNKSTTYWHDRSSSSTVAGESSTSWYRRHRIANENIRIRGEKVSIGVEGQSQTMMSVEDRKTAIKERIYRMKEERKRMKKLEEVDSDADVLLSSSSSSRRRTVSRFG